MVGVLRRIRVPGLDRAASVPMEGNRGHTKEKMMAVLKQKGVQPGISKMYLIKLPVSVYIFFIIFFGQVYTMCGLCSPLWVWMLSGPVLEPGTGGVLSPWMDAGMFIDECVFDLFCGDPVHLVRGHCCLWWGACSVWLAFRDACAGLLVV